MSNILITGANRGIGLEFTKQLLANGARVFACCRNPNEAEELQALMNTASKNLSIHALDVTSESQIAALANELKDQPIDILINNAGYMGNNQSELSELNEKDWLDVFSINTISPMILVKHFVEHLKRGEKKIIANLTSRMGSIEDNSSGSYYYYRSSKTALNMAMKGLAVELAGDGIKVLLLHPGWVQTSMGGANALIDTETSVKGLLNVIDNAKAEDLAKYIAYNGEVIPW